MLSFIGQDWGYGILLRGVGEYIATVDLPCRRRGRTHSGCRQATIALVPRSENDKE